MGSPGWRALCPASHPRRPSPHHRARRAGGRPGPPAGRPCAGSARPADPARPASAGPGARHPDDPAGAACPRGGVAIRRSGCHFLRHRPGRPCRRPDSRRRLAHRPPGRTPGGPSKHQAWRPARPSPSGPIPSSAHPLAVDPLAANVGAGVGGPAAATGAALPPLPPAPPVPPVPRAAADRRCRPCRRCRSTAPAAGAGGPPVPPVPEGCGRITGSLAAG